MRRVTYGNGRYVAITRDTTSGATSTNRYVHSADGINWTNGILPFTAEWSEILYAGGYFVVVAEKGPVAYSNDGLTWSNSLLPSPPTGTVHTWASIAYDGSRYIILGSHGKLATSTDLANWTISTLPVPAISSPFYQAIFFINNIYVAIVASFTTNVYSTIYYTSTDLITWTQRSLPVNTNWGWGSSTVNGIIFIRGRTSGSPNINYIYRSTNGINWSSVSYIPLIYHVNQYVALNGSDVYTSSNLSTWTFNQTIPTGSWVDLASNGVNRIVAISYSNSNVVAYADAL